MSEPNGGHHSETPEFKAPAEKSGNLVIAAIVATLIFFVVIMWIAQTPAPPQ